MLLLVDVAGAETNAFPDGMETSTGQTTYWKGEPSPTDINIQCCHQ
jgi:hypothetical protein